MKKSFETVNYEIWNKPVKKLHRLIGNQIEIKSRDKIEHQLIKIEIQVWHNVWGHLYGHVHKQQPLYF